MQSMNPTSPSPHHVPVTPIVGPTPVSVVSSRAASQTSNTAATPSPSRPPSVASATSSGRIAPVSSPLPDVSLTQTTTSIGTTSRPASPIAAPLGPGPSQRQSGSAVPKPAYPRWVSFRLDALAYATGWKYFLLAATIYTLTLGITLTVSYRFTLLGAVSIPVGIFILNLLAKSGDVAFALAVGEALDNSLAAKLATTGSLPMEKVLALSTSTGLYSLLSMASYKSRTLRATRHWAFIHAVAILVSPGPGLLLMASVDPKDYYFSSRTLNATADPNADVHNVSAGLAQYDPDMALIAQDVPRAYVPFLTQGLLQDSLYSAPLPPFTEACKKVGANCSSVLLSGGIQTIKPQPRLSAVQTSDSRSFFKAHDVASYHIDYWTNQTPEMWNTTTSTCRVYTADFRFQMCVDLDLEVQGALRAGWRSCAIDSVSTTPSPDSCNDNFDLLNPHYPTWSTIHMHMVNRTATQTLSLKRGTIESVGTLGDYRPVVIDPNDIFIALDQLLWPSAKNISSLDDTKTLQWAVTTFLGNTLALRQPNLATRSRSTFAAEIILANTVMMPLFLFNPLLISTAPIGTDSEAPQPDLGTSFYVQAYYAYRSRRPTPRFETIVAYAALGGTILLGLLLVQCLVLRKPVKSSAFPLLDITTKLKVVDGTSTPSGTPQEVEDLHDRFVHTTSARQTLGEAVKLSVTIR